MVTFFYKILTYLLLKLLIKLLIKGKRDKVGTYRNVQGGVGLVTGLILPKQMTFSVAERGAPSKTNFYTEQRVLYLDGNRVSSGIWTRGEGSPKRNPIFHLFCAPKYTEVIASPSFPNSFKSSTF